MSSAVVHVHVGQAGNAVGGKLWQTFAKEAEETPEISHCFFDAAGRARAVFVDTEPKVLYDISQDDKHGIYSFQHNMLYEQSGRGKNWAMGYSVSSAADEESSLLARTLQRIRYQAERCDAFEGVMLSHSIAGGTGSGLGSRLVEAIRSEFPRACIFSNAIAPFTRGDNPLQFYNTLLSLHTLQQLTDGVIWFHNSSLMAQLTHSNDKSVHIPKAGAKQVDIDDMNELVTVQLYNVLAPLTRQGIVHPFRLSDAKTACCPLDEAKMCEVYTSVNLPWPKKQSTRGGFYGWEPITDSLVQNIPRYNGNKSATLLSGMLFARGRLWSKEQGQLLPKILRRLSPIPYHHTTPLSTYTGSEAAYTTKPVPHSLSILANRDSVIEPLRYSVNRAAEMFDAKAYLHWYARYGCHEDWFEEAFETAQQLFEDYRHFGNHK